MPIWARESRPCKRCYLTFRQNTRKSLTYRFNFVNFMKKGTLFNSGMQICVYSEHTAQTTGVGWRRDGHSIVSYPSMIPFRGGRKLYNIMSFSYTAVADDDTVYFAFAYPYTYTQLQQYIRAHLGKPNIDTMMRRRRLCLTRGGNECDLLTITNFTDTKTAYGAFHRTFNAISHQQRIDQARGGADGARAPRGDSGQLDDEGRAGLSP